MNSNFKKFIKNSGIFFIGSVLSKAISILLLPLYTNKIPPTDMGYYDLSLTIITIVTSVVFLDIWVAILRFMYDKNEEKKVIISSGFIIYLISSLIYIIIGLSIMFTIDIKSIGLILTYGISMNTAEFFAFCCRGYGKNKEYALSGVINTIINVSCNLVCILALNMGYQSLYISSILGFIVQIIYLLYKIKISKVLNIKYFDFSKFKSIFIYSLPLCLNSVCFWLLANLNRVILNSIYGDAINGIYAIGNKFTFVIFLATNCFTYAWQDISFSKNNDDASIGKFYGDACCLYVKFLCFSCCIMLPFLKILFPLLISNDYGEAMNTIPLFLINALISAVSTFIGNIFYAIKETKTIFISTIIGALINILIGRYLIIKFGINGANISVIIAFLFNILIRLIVLHKKINMSISPKVIFVIMLVAISAYTFIYANLLFNFVVMLFIFIAFLYIFRVYLKDAIEQLKKIKKS